MMRGDEEGRDEIRRDERRRREERKGDEIPLAKKAHQSKRDRLAFEGVVDVMAIIVEHEEGVDPEDFWKM